MTDAAAEPWRATEKGILADWVQLTFSDRFVKAGESYFSPDDSKIIFQAVEKPAGGPSPVEFFAMFVGDIVREGASGRISGLRNITRISPAGSANTCGWFHPTRPNIVIFASTIGKPEQEGAPGFQRGGPYVWMFPKNMRIVECDLAKADATAESLKILAGDGESYCAEGSISPDGRHLLYSSTQSGEGDLFIKSLQTGDVTRIVQARGYDGGPFFSHDGKRICYRSDRLGDSLLQLFVADLAFNDQGEIIGIEREYQLTDESCVNWCPYWTRDGRRLIYASSALGEQNFEVYMTDADPGNLPGSDGTIRYGSARRRLTHFDQANAVPASDVLPALSQDGKWMIWTSRRGPDSQVHLWAARFVLDPDAPWKRSPPSAGPPPAPQPQRAAENQIVVEDPDNGRIFVYDAKTHKLSEYDPRTHQLSEITDPADIERFKKLHAEQQKKDEP
jgi:TolB protein